MPTYKQDVKLGTMVPLIKTDDIDKSAITTDRLADASVTTGKIAKGSVTAEKLSPSLLKLIEAATGIPSDTILEIEQAFKDIQTLKGKTQKLEKMIQDIISQGSSVSKIENSDIADIWERN